MTAKARAPAPKRGIYGLMETPHVVGKLGPVRLGDKYRGGLVVMLERDVGIVWTVDINDFAEAQRVHGP